VDGAGLGQGQTRDKNKGEEREDFAHVQFVICVPVVYGANPSLAIGFSQAMDVLRLRGLLALAWR
jgi:hypothetical protein